MGDEYLEAGAVASDETDGDVTSEIIIAGDDMNTNASGSYTITYDVSDAAAPQLTYTHGQGVATPVEDNTSPVITLNGDASVTIILGDKYLEAGAVASDETDGNITSEIIIAGDNVNTNALGSYTITYDVSDGGQLTVQLTRTVRW